MSSNRLETCYESAPVSVPCAKDDSPFGLRKRMLYVALPGVAAPLFETPGTPEDGGGSPLDASTMVQPGGERVDVARATTPGEALDILTKHYVHAVVIDARVPPVEEGGTVLGHAAALLDLLDHPEDLEARYGFHRIIVLLPPGSTPSLDKAILELGGRGVGAVVRQGAGEEPRGFAERVVEEALALVQRHRTGSMALCASGGGVTGIFFELGVLKCLDDCLVERRVNDFDLYFGISAGAVISGVLAMGFSVDEFMAAIAGIPGGRIPPLDLRVLQLSHLNYGDIGRRAASGAMSLWRDLRDYATGRARPSFDGFLLEYGDLIGAPFRSDRFEEILRGLFALPGATNEFSELPVPLFIGASDQDARLHVLFGEEGSPAPPISRAIQASLSVNPAFAAVRIGARYYEDGAVTRTSDFVEAIRRGARLIFIVDPFVPYVAKKPGTVRRRGILYNVDQDLRTLSYTRFENTRNWVLRQHPEVSSYTFLPSNRLRLLLGVSPMDHRPFLTIWRGAYLSTLQRIERVCHRLRGDLAGHGVHVDTARAHAVAARLRATDVPAFSDFFPDGAVRIRTPPLARHRRSASGARRSTATSSP